MFTINLKSTGFCPVKYSVVVCCLWGCVFSLCTLIMLMALHNMGFKDSGSLTGAGFSRSGEPMDGLCGNPQSRQQPQGAASLWQGQWVFFSLVQFVKGPRKAIFVCKRTLKINPIMKVLCITWPLNLIKCHCHESKYVYEGRNACRSGRISSACFNLEIRTRSVT